MSMTNGMKGFINVGVSQMMDALDFCHKMGMDYESAKQHAAMIAMYTGHKKVDKEFGGRSASEITSRLRKISAKK